MILNILSNWNLTCQLGMLSHYFMIYYFILLDKLKIENIKPKKKNYSNLNTDSLKNI